MTEKLLFFHYYRIFFIIIIIILLLKNIHPNNIPAYLEYSSTPNLILSGYTQFLLGDPKLFPDR